MSFAVLELCAGGGGQALGLEMAGFHHAAAVEYEPQFCTTLRKNRPQWNVKQEDIRLDEFLANRFGRSYADNGTTAAEAALLRAAS